MEIAMLYMVMEILALVEIFPLTSYVVLWKAQETNSLNS
jgi:hypothetical protein